MSEKYSPERADDIDTLPERLKEWPTHHIAFLDSRYKDAEAGRVPYGKRHSMIIAELARRRLEIDA